MKSETFQRRIEDEKVEGWSVDEDGDERVVLVKRGYGNVGGHVIIALLTIWWTIGLGNVAYAAYHYTAGADRKVVRDERSDSDE